MPPTDTTHTTTAGPDSAPHGPDLARRLVAAVRYCQVSSEHYRRRLADAGAEPEDITTLEALAQLPIMLEKADEVALQRVSREQLGHPFGEYLCAPLGDVVGVASTSGTTGVPSYYAFTQSDIDTTDAAWGLAFEMAGIRPGDAVVQGFGMSMFLAGHAVVRALERYGARAIPVGAEAGSEKLLRVAEHMRATAICCTPSYGTYLTEKTDLTGLGIRHVVCAGEPGAGLPEVRARLSEGFGGATVTDVLGGVHGVMNVSCSAHSGMHMLGQHNVIQQLVDPDTGAPVELVDGAIGVRVKTTLGWQAQPQLRGSVGDVYEIRTARCDCGHESPRARVIGRTDDMLIIKGVKLYPAAVQNLIHEMRPRLTGHFRIMLPERGPRVEPPLRLQVEVERGGIEATAALVAAMHSRFAVTPVVEALAPGTLPRATHKAKLIHIEPAEERGGGYPASG